jgi:hypothetical protein
MDCPNRSSGTKSVLKQRVYNTVADELLEDYRPFHSEFQIRHLILTRSGGTIWGCYQQSLREISARWACLENDQVNGSHHLEETSCPYADRLKLILQNRVLKDQRRELAVFLAYAILLKAVLGHVSDQRLAELDRELWVYRIRALLARDYLCLGHPSVETVELIHVVPHEIRAECMSAVKDLTMRERLIGWYLNYYLELPVPTPRLIEQLTVELQKPAVLADEGVGWRDLLQPKHNINATIANMFT